MTVDRRGGTGERVKMSMGGLSMLQGGLHARTLLYSLFFHSLDKGKNPDWSDLMNYSIWPSDWSATCHSRA